MTDKREKMKEFYLNKNYSKIRFISYISILLFIILYFFLIQNNKYFGFLYVFYFLLLIFLEYTNYNNVIISLENENLKIIWQNSFKKKYIDINKITNINLTKDFLQIEANENYKYIISTFKNEQRKKLLTFFKSNFNNVTIN